MTNTFAPAPTSFNNRKIRLPGKSKIAVVGAGAFGGWASLFLLRSGYKVTLVDAWGAGNTLSSSGDETRVTRSTYGANEFYFRMNIRSLELWKENEQRWNKQLFFNTGVLWLCYQEINPLIDDSIPFAKKYNAEYKYLTRDQLSKQYPLINCEDLHHGWFDPHGGYLKARESCQAVNEGFLREGGTFIQASVKPGKIVSGQIENILLSTGERITADVYLFACGAWLPQLFPAVLGGKIICTKQEIYYFKTPKVQSKVYGSLPVWVDLDGQDYYYGIAGNRNRGFKIGVDIRGELFDPTNGERTRNPETFTKALKFIAHRFPGLKDAPLLENRVCPYENSPDGNFIFEQHPGANNVWFLGGGSGHGFKHGPALGEWVANSFR